MADAYWGSYYHETPELLRDVQDLYKKVHGFYPSRQALVNFCAQSLRINILPYLPKERSRVQRSLTQLSRCVRRRVVGRVAECRQSVIARP